jgi:hypothetical protein
VKVPATESTVTLIVPVTTAKDESSPRMSRHTGRRSTMFRGVHDGASSEG